MASFLKNVMLRFSVAILAFIFGISSILIYSSTQTLPYCIVARNPDLFNGMQVRVKGRLVFESDGMYILEECDPVSALASLVEFEGGDSTKPKARHYVEELLTTGEKQNVKQAEAIIEGQFNGDYSKGCWGRGFISMP